MVRLGYGSITTVTVTYIATQIGFCQFVDEPFCVVARVAGVPVLSGSKETRIVVWIVATLIGLVYTGLRLTREKESAAVPRPRIDRYFREQQDEVVSALSPSATGWYCWSDRRNDLGRLGRDCRTVLFRGSPGQFFHHGRGDRPHRRYLPPQRYDGQA